MATWKGEVMQSVSDRLDLEGYEVEILRTLADAIDGPGEIPRWKDISAVKRMSDEHAEQCRLRLQRAGLIRVFTTLQMEITEAGMWELAGAEVEMERAAERYDGDRFSGPELEPEEIECLRSVTKDHYSGRISTKWSDITVVRENPQFEKVMRARLCNRGYLKNLTRGSVQKTDAGLEVVKQADEAQTKPQRKSLGKWVWSAIVAAGFGLWWFVDFTDKVIAMSKTVGGWFE